MKKGGGTLDGPTKSELKGNPKGAYEKRSPPKLQEGTRRKLTLHREAELGEAEY